MLSPLPLDDLIGQSFYIDGAVWRYLYNKSIRRFALRRTQLEISFELALEQIASGELLWSPPERFERVPSNAPMDVVQQRVALLESFRRSPGYVDSIDWTMRARIDAQLTESRNWLTRRALTSGDATGTAPSDGD
jgi:hypothetical protein